jgi:hypothetical protein
MTLPRRGDMSTPDPDPTEFQLFGGLIGVMIVGGAVIGLLYGLLQFIMWAIST